MSKRVINFFGYSDLVSFQVFQFCIPRGVLNLINTYLFTILPRHSLYYLNLGRLVIQTLVHLRKIQESDLLQKQSLLYDLDLYLNHLDYALQWDEH